MHQKKTLKHNKKASRETLRIISGAWRGRRLPIINTTEIRPTLDHIREMLFNWLMFDIEGAYCLDAFAGSGALGIEALSRQAKEVVFLEKSEQTTKFIEKNMQHLHCKRYQLFTTDTLQWLEKIPAFPFDIIFLDPPFYQNLIPLVCQLLQNRKWLQANTLIYIEMEKTACFTPSDNWQLIKQKTTKKIVSCLLKVI